jgi:DNA-binding transcriptional LysR family regulator
MHHSLLITLPSFVRVVEQQSFGKAAAILGLTRSAVSKHVQALEDGLKVRLINRTTRTLAPTEEGKAFYRTAVMIVEELQNVERLITHSTERPGGILRINAPESFGMFYLAPVITAFAARYPDMTLEVEFTDRFVNIIEERVDVAIRVASLTDSSLIARKLARCQMVMAASPDYLAKHGTPTRPDQLINHRMIGYSYNDRPTEFRYQTKDGTPQVAPVTPTFRANNSEMLRRAALDGLGVLCVPSFIVGPDVRVGKLTRVMPDILPLPERNIYALYPQNHHMSAKVRLFIDFVAEAFAKPSWEV